MALNDTMNFETNRPIPVSQGPNFTEVIKMVPPNQFDSGTGRIAPISPENPNDSNVSSSSLTSVLIPLCSVLVISLLAVTAYKSWRYYRSKLPLQNNQHRRPPDIEQNFEEGAPLRIPPLDRNSLIDARYVDTQILQEAENLTKSREDSRTDECTSVPNHIQSTESNIPNHRETVQPAVTFVVEDETSNINTENSQIEEKSEQNNEEELQRPNTLRFLAASAAFQASTVPALKRLPYTPDPDSTIPEAPEVLSLPSPVREVEAKDTVTPLAQAPRRMKPRGLLERRGSNVALTISLRPGDDSNSSSSTEVSKSPKPLAYLQKASSLLTVEELHEKCCDTSALQKEFWAIPMNHPSEKNFNVPGHGTKNRHRILPNDHSRVKLPQKPGEDHLSSYINANYIRDYADLRPASVAVITDEKDLIPVTRSDAMFIATQGPLANTIEDFWRMVWLENVSSVVMLTKLKERKEKCAQYFPINQNDVVTYESITVRVVNVKKHEHFTVRTMEVSLDGSTRTICHYWYNTWMDHETPEKTRGLLEMVQEVSMWKKQDHGPIVVHCSAGIGRTGCYIAVFVGCQQLMKSGKTDILKIVAQMRLDRGGMVQTWEQYQFVHQALSRYGRILAGENVTTPSTAGSIRSPRELKGGLVDSARHTKHRRSTSDTNLPSPKELKVGILTSTSKNSLTRRRAADKFHTSATPPCNPHLVPCLTSPKLNSVRSVSSPTIQSPFGRMCLQSKDMNAGTSPIDSTKFQWPSATTPNGREKLDSKENPGSNNASPRRFKFAFTTLALSPSDKALGKKTPQSGNNTTEKPSFDLPTNHTNLLTNGYLDNRSNVQSASSPHARCHFIFPSPGAR